MTGHAIKVIMEDNEIRASLAAIGQLSPSTAASNSQLAIT